MNIGLKSENTCGSYSDNKEEDSWPHSFNIMNNLIPYDHNSQLALEYSIICCYKDPSKLTIGFTVQYTILVYITGCLALEMKTF